MDEKPKVIVHRHIDEDPREHLTDGSMCWCLPNVIEDVDPGCPQCNHPLVDHVFNHGAGPAGEILRYSCTYMPVGTWPMCECVFERIEGVTEIEATA